MKVSRVYTFKPEISEKEFLRYVLINFYCNENAPADIFEADFKEVSSTIKNILYCSNVQVDLRCYYYYSYSGLSSYPTQYREDFGSQKTIYIDGEEHTVSKGRAVTSPPGCLAINHHESEYVSVGIFNEPNHSFRYDNHLQIDSLFLHLSLLNKKKLVKEDARGMDADSNALDGLKKACLVECVMQKFGGKDSHKYHQIKITSDPIDIKSVDLYKIPYYKVNFIYRGKEYFAEGFAYEWPVITTNLVFSKGANPIIRQICSFKKMTIIFSIISIAFFVFSSIFLRFLLVKWYGLFYAVAAVFALLAMFFGAKFFLGKKNVSEKSKQNIRNEKKTLPQHLAEKFKSSDFREPNSMEIEAYESKNIAMEKGTDTFNRFIKKGIIKLD